MTQCSHFGYSFTARECSDEELRLAGGPSPNEGKVELCYKGLWGTVCDRSWSDSHALLVCRQLGHSTGCNFSDQKLGYASNNYLTVHCSSQMLILAHFTLALLLKWLLFSVQARKAASSSVLILETL